MTLYTIFSYFDSVIYNMVAFSVKLIMLIANYDFFKQDVISTMYSKVYVILGVIMLFKIVISAVQYMINPDTFDDKDKGMGGILKKAAISIALIAMLEPIFNFAMTMQKSIVSTIPNIILDVDQENYAINEKNSSKALSTFDDIGDKVAAISLKAFVSLKATAKEGDTIASEFNNVQPGTGTTRMDVILKNITQGCNQPGGLLHIDFNTESCDYNYSFGISTAAGIFLLYIMIMMMIDIGIRSIKLGIIQLLAPIPISGYITSKDKLSKFFKLAGKVYADLFIRLGIIYFIIFFVEKVITSITDDVTVLGTSVDPTSAAFIRIAIIISLFYFAKKAPGFISEVLGLGGDGIGDMKDMFTRGGGVAGATWAGMKTAKSNFITQKERAYGKGMSSKRQIAEGLRSAAAGFASSTGRGLWMTGQGKGFKDVRQNAFNSAIAARNKRNDKLDNIINTDVDKYLKDSNGNYLYVQEPDPNNPGKTRDKVDKHGNKTKIRNPEYYSRSDYRRDVRREKLGIPSSTAYTKARYDVMEKTAKAAADAKSHGVGKMNETPGRYKIDLDLSKNANGIYNDTDAVTINQALGYDALTMEHVRNLYTMAKNGNAVETKNGQKVRLTDAQLNALGNLVQTIEKRTSYMKEAELMGSGDPAALPNFEKIKMLIAGNKDMYNNREIMQSIVTKFAKDNKWSSTDIQEFENDIKELGGAGAIIKRIDVLRSDLQIKLPKEPIYEGVDEPVMPTEPVKPTFNLTMPTKPIPPMLKKNANNADRARYAAEFEQYKIDLSNYNQQMQTYASEQAKYNQQVQEYNIQMASLPQAQAQYQAQKAQYDADQAAFATKKAQYESQYDAWLGEVEKRANMLTAIKDAYEEVAKIEFPNAQFADIRAQKAQKAVSNSDKKS